MKLFGLLLAKNEADIIAELLAFLRELDIYDRIFFFDLGSEDDTMRQTAAFTDILAERQVLDRPYSERLRMEMLLDHARYYRAGDWLAIIDADEFYADDPWDLIAAAEREEDVDSIHTFQAQFYLTDADVEALGDENPRDSIRARRRHYLVNWSEPRLFKYRPDRPLPLTWERPCSRRLLNRHYQYRTPAQVETRIRTRLDNLDRRQSERRADYRPWMHLHSMEWRDYVVPSALLHYDDGGPLQFGLPHGAVHDAYRVPPFDVKTPELAAHYQRERSERPVVRVEATDRERLRGGPPVVHPRLLELGVTATHAGEPFNLQSDGSAALWVRHEHAEPGTVIVFDGRPLRTLAAGHDILTALVPLDLYASPGAKPVRLMVAGVSSNELIFEVR